MYPTDKIGFESWQDSKSTNKQNVKISLETHFQIKYCTLSLKKKEVPDLRRLKTLEVWFDKWAWSSSAAVITQNISSPSTDVPAHVQYL